MTARLAVENAFSVVQFPLHTITANEAGTGSEAFRFATGRRADHWSPTTTNADAWIKVACDRTRAFDCVRLWDHNLAGYTVRVQCSDDDFTTTQTVFNATLPTMPATGAVDDDFGVLTEDSMWLLVFPVRAAKYWRIYVPAMGSGLKPSINGGLGLSVTFDRDRGDLVDANDLSAMEERSEAGYLGRGTRALVRGGAVTIKQPSLFAYEHLRYHIQRFGAGSPGVLVFDDERAEQAVMAIRPLGRMGFRQDRSWFYPQGELPWVEHEPPEVA